MAGSNVWCMHAKSLQSCLTLWDHMDFRPPGSSVHGILQARILEWAAMPSSRGSSRPRGRTRVSCIAGGFFTTEPTKKPWENWISKCKRMKLDLHFTPYTKVNSKDQRPEYNEKLLEENIVMVDNAMDQAMTPSQKAQPTKNIMLHWILPRK